MNDVQFPPQLLPMSRKGKAWRKACVDYVDSRLHFNYAAIRQSVIHLKINYDLIIGKLHMEDLELICNPNGIKAGFIPDKILHYPIMNAKLNVLKGEELKRVFDHRVIITNPNAISEIENNKKQAILLGLLELIQNNALSDEEFNAGLEKLNDYYTYEWQDFREIRGNCVLNHYIKEYNMPLMFNAGFTDAYTVGEEIYQCDIVGGEPVISRLNPLKVKILRSGYSNRIEDADMVILEDYWPIGEVYDTYYQVLTKKDIEYLEKVPDNFTTVTDTMDNIDERYGLINTNMISDIMPSEYFFDPFGEYTDGIGDLMLPYDNLGNIRVLRLYWKSRRKIKKIKFYDQETGEEDFTFMPETYVTNMDEGEEEEVFWVNEAWEGTKIGKEIYVNIRPRVVLYNSLDNPSRCHFGIIGSIYNINDNKPFSLVDMMKPYNYLYDIIYDRLNKMISRNWGKMTRLDLSKKPASWDMDKWLYFAKTLGLFVEDSFNEGNIGAATGKLAGALNSNSQGVIDADFGNNIALYISLLQFIEEGMATVAGISKQREGQISNRETVGGVERATLQSSHITEWIFSIHDDVKRRVLEAFLETAKIAMRGRTKKFQYILPDHSIKMIEIDGDEFAECDYGLVVDSSNGIQELNQKLETLAQAALQNQSLSFATIMKLFMSASLAEKQRYVENDERRIKEEQQQQFQLQMLQQQEQIQANMQNAQAEREFKDMLNQRDNETKVMVAEINSQAEMAVLQLKNHMTEADENTEETYSLEALDKLNESKRQFDKNFLLLKERLEFDKKKAETDAAIKRESLKKKNTTNK